MTPETNPVHSCHGCQSCLALLLDDAGADAPPPCGRYPECDPPDESNTCEWPSCSDAEDMP